VRLHLRGQGSATISADLADDDATRIFNRLTALAYGLDAETDGDNDGDGRRSLDQRRADLFTDLLLGPPLGQPGDSPNAAAPATVAGSEVAVVIDLPTLLRMADNPADMPGCGPVAAEIARQLAADAKWRAWLTDTVGGQVIATSPSTYRPTAAVARLVRAREPYCRMPGCRAEITDLDHVIPFPKGATTPQSVGDCRHKTPCNGDGTRAKFGTRAGLVIDPDEAVLLTDSYAMVKDGASLNATFRRFRESGGQLGDPSTLRKALLNPRNAGLVAHGGVVVAEAADGHAIVDRDTFDRVTAILKDPSRRTAPGRPSHTLLGKSLHCGLCGSTMAASRKVGRPTYVCVKNQHLVIVRDLVDKPVLELVGRIVAGLADAGVLTMPDPTGDAAVQLLRDQAADIESRLDGLSGLLAAGDLDPVDYAAATRKLRDRLAGIAAQLTRRSGRPALASLNGHSGGVTAAWNQVVADARDGRVDGLRAIMAELLDGIDLFRGRRAVLRWKTWVDLPATDLQLTTRRAWDRDERRAAVRRLHDDGMTQLDIAATLQINRSTVWKDLKATA
jgi:hypothetical protein